MELGERVLEGGHTHWNPGITQVPQVPQQQQQQGSQQSEGWQGMQAAECLMNPTSTVTDMFGGYPLILSSSDGGTHRISEFSRHRFPPISAHSSSMHFSNIPSSPSGLGHGSHHEGGLINGGLINIPTIAHPTLGNGTDSEGNASVQVQDRQNSLGLEMEGGHHHGLDDCSEECSDDEEEEDEIEDSDEEEMGYINHNQTMSHPSMNVEQEHPLPSCQHPRQLRVINSNGGDVNVNMMGNNINMDNHQKNSIMSQIHDIEEEIPPISQGHPLNSNPISAIPMITGNCSMMMSDQEEGVVGGGNTSQQSGEPLLGMNNGGSGDPSSCSSSGHSVHGKMYVEERVVFHLKQWTESGFGNFNSCREQDQQKNQYGCAVCHIRSPHNSLSNKDTHRHLVRGILFSFEDCIILELYPEEYTDNGGQEPRSHHHSLSMDPKDAIHMESTNKGDEEAVPLSYFNPSTSTTMPDIALPQHEPHSSLEKPSIGHNHINSQQGGGGWWEYESTDRDDVVEIDGQHSIDHHVTPESCAINLKLTAQHFHDAQAAVAARETNEMEEITNEVQRQIEIHHEGIDDSENISYQDSQSKYNHSLPSHSHQYYSTAESMPENHTLTTISSKCIVEDEDDNNQDEAEMPSPMPDDRVCQSPVPIQSRADEFRQSAEQPLENDRSLEIPSASLLPDSDQGEDHDGSVPPSRRGQNMTTKMTKKSKSKKYPCSWCEKYFTIERHLKNHLKTKHTAIDGKVQTVQYTDDERLRNSCTTLSLESVSNTLKNERIKIQESTTTDSSNSNAESSDTVLSPPSPDGESEILELVLTSKSSKVRKFSEKASRKLQKQTAAGSSAISSTELQSPAAGLGVEEKLENSKKCLVTSIGDEENRTEKNEGRGETSVRSCSNKLIITPPIKINHDQNLHFAVPEVTDALEMKPIKSKEFRCEVCGRCFSQLRRLTNHAACHKPEKSSQCEQCGKSFARRDKLLRHMFVHNEEKMFSCHICEKRFSRRDKLSDHLKSHQTDEIHNCNVCERQFLRPDILKQHLKMHLMEDKYQCSECLRFVTGKERLDQHMKRHEEAKASGLTLLCPLCTKYFIQAQSLKAHIRKFHPDALSQLNLNQLQFGTSSSDEKECGAQNNLDDNNLRCTESPPSSGSNSSSSMEQSTTDPKSLQVQKKTLPAEKSSTPVCQVLENVMSSNSRSKSKQRKVLNKSVAADKKISTDVKLTFSCAQCSKSFSRNQTLKNHETRKHPSKLSKSKIPSAGTTSSNNSSDEPHEDKKHSSKQGKPLNKGPGGSSESEQPATRLIPKKKYKPIKTRADTLGKVKRKIVNSTKPSTESVSAPLNPSLQIVRQTLSLPSCASLTQDLGFNLNSNTGNNSSFQQTHLNPYSHQLALNSLVVGEGGLQNPLPMGSLIVTGLPHQDGQQLSSILVNAQGQHLEIGQSICSQTSSFVISYPSPATATMSFQP